MFVISENDRRAGTSPTEVPREIPVLFHLLDVTPRPAVVPPPPVKAAELQPPPSAGEQLAMATSEPVAPPLPAVERAAPPVALVPPEPPPADAEPHSPPATATSEPLSVGDAMDGHNNPVPGRAADATSEPPAEPSADETAKVSPRTPLPRRSPKTPASEDWFASHGKYIALGFVLALAGTIYAARATRAKPAPTAEAPRAPAPLADEPPVITIPRMAAARDDAHPATADVSPANLVEAATAMSDPKAELHPPTGASLASQPAAGGAAGKDGLFEFSPPKKDEPHIAGRASADSPAPALSPSTTPPATVAAAVAPASPAAAAPTSPATAPPDLSPSYPTTASPMPTYPVTTPAAHAYPVTAAAAGYGAPPMPGPYAGGPSTPSQPAPSYSGPYSGSPPANPAAAPWPTAPAGGMPAPYQPPYNTASGRRYEPTGSGNY